MNLIPKSLLGDVVVTGDHTLTLKHPEHGEEYHSDLGAGTEARQLYIEQSGFLQALQQAGRQEIAVLDVGLGLGYNALATIAAWCAAGTPPDLYLTSLEIDSALVAALSSAEAPWMAGWPNEWRLCCGKLQVQQEGVYRTQISHPTSSAVCRWQVMVGDAATQEDLSLGVQEGYHYIWQDAFSPQKNPALWSAAWFAKLKRVSHADVVLLTYSVARMVRDGLSQSGWLYQKLPAQGKKRHWLSAKLT
jgi:tRNA U34 5-methylaminomethyl-2-thiouridine-forming methyltransferase MnmC